MEMEPQEKNGGDVQLPSDEDPRVKGRGGFKALPSIMEADSFPQTY
ncbi:hypothetical protein ACP4OV_025018 [Aristida adscensionis]